MLEEMKLYEMSLCRLLFNSISERVRYQFEHKKRYFISKFKNIIPNLVLLNIEKQMVPCKSTAEEVSFEWSHHRISSTDSKVTTTLTLHVSITNVQERSG